MNEAKSLNYFHVFLGWGASSFVGGEETLAPVLAHIHVTMASSEMYSTSYGEIVEEESSDEEEDGIPYQAKLASSIYLSRITSTGQVLWKHQIDDVGNKHAALHAEASAADERRFFVRSRAAQPPRA